MIDYRQYFTTSKAVKRELAALAALDRDSFTGRAYSKRRARLVRMYWALKNGNR
jgi:hypothetical protein